MHNDTRTRLVLELRHAAKLDYKTHGLKILRQNFVNFKKLYDFDFKDEPLHPKSAEAYLQGLVELVHGKSKGKAINADLLKDILNDIGKVTLNDVDALVYIKSEVDLLKFKKSYAKLAVEYLLPHVADIKELVKLVGIFEAYYNKPSDY